MDKGLSGVIAGTFRRQGWEAKESPDLVEFDNPCVRGTVTLKKPFTVTWKCKKGFEILDVPLSAGNTSAQFPNLGRLFDFLQRRLLFTFRD